MTKHYLQMIEEDQRRRQALQEAAEVVFDKFFESEELETQGDYFAWIDEMREAVMEMGEYLPVHKIGDK